MGAAAGFKAYRAVFVAAECDIPRLSGYLVSPTRDRTAVPSHFPRLARTREASVEFTLVNLLLVMLLAWLAGAAANRLGYPSIVGELGAGILFGPAILGWLHTDSGLTVLAELGVFMMMLYIGMEVDHRELMAASWAGLLAAIGSFVVPGVLGYLFLRDLVPDRASAIFVAIAMGVTALAVNSRVIVDLNLLGTRLANVLIAAALISDTVAIIVFSGLVGVLQSGTLQLASLVGVLAKALVFFGVTTVLGVWVFPFVGQRLIQAGFTARTANFTLVLLVALVFALMAELAGLHSILGAFIAGLFLREEVLMRKLSQDLSAIVHDLSIGFLAPIFFVTVAFHFTFSVFQSSAMLLVCMVLVSAVGKTLGTLLAYLPTRHGWREGLVVATGMNGRGAVDVIFAGIGLERRIINEDIFSSLVFVAFLNVAVVPALLNRGAQWLRRRGELVRSDEKRSGVIFVGAGPVARVLAQELAGTEPVRLVDTNQSNCALAQAEGLTVINGNALREETLSMVNAARARALIALTPNAEVNRFTIELARNVFGIPDVYTYALPREEGSGNAAVPSAAETPLFGGRVVLGEWNRSVARKEVQRTSLAVARQLSPTELFRQINENDALLPLLVIREGQRCLFHTVDQLRPGDEVLALRRREGGEESLGRVQDTLRACPVLDISDSTPMEAFFRQVAETMAPRVKTPADTLHRLLLERERDSSTVILPSVAIPHILIEGQATFDMLLARCRDGIRFSDSAARVRIVFIIIGSRDERNLHLRALASIGHLFQQADFEERWLAAPGPEDLRRLVLSDRRRG